MSIASSQTGYGGYCHFGFLVQISDDQLPPDEWLRRGRIDPRMVTAYSAAYAGEDDYLEGSERDDLEKIHTLLLRLSADEQERSAIHEACWKEAQQILVDHWLAVQALATKLLKH